ncbi:MAG: prepilin-type N-terminal cleavage/methylation domain-containing protein [Fimbriimonadaceae bacterium]|nr:prepilin-type N-terminal cleavage/methylation domain-containing protein [Chthonomonadaceae bacterium]MCO5296986.1 prepilin-type N-terminal cleavage/methylation domain-containing protein [Fimbriimonadaceae bacterium]
MKRAFTLIELLVVIAIIAILAAILFPVFAQAKTAAKKAVSISNQKQIGLAVIMYASDYDDIYPRNDDCILNGALNTALNTFAPGSDPSSRCNGSDAAHPYAFRVNHYKWQAWVLPYTKNVALFFHPAIDKNAANWDKNGEIMNSYALNLALTGALNTWPNYSGNGAWRDPFLGGTSTAIPYPAEGWLIMELVDPTVSFAPVFLDSSSGTSHRTAYPFAIREAWATKFYTIDTNCNVSNQLDNSKVPFAGAINLSFADGHTKSISIGQFLAKTPSAAEYQVSSRPACGLGSGAWTVSAKPVWTQSWPLWSLQ